jgi:hypothetical protein
MAAIYKPTLVSMMSYLDSVQYDKDHTFTDVQLGLVTAADVLRWMNVKTFGIPDPPLDANPTLARSNSIKYWKKALSFFMPNRLMAWNRLTNQGNPTRSIEINDLIKRVKKKEVCKQGVPSSARRPMKEREFRRLHYILRESANVLWKLGIPALLNFMYHLIARIDDSTQVMMEHLRAHDNFDFALKCRLNWSKNVEEERDAPWQLFIGCMDPM